MFALLAWPTTPLKSAMSRFDLSDVSEFEGSQEPQLQDHHSDPVEGAAGVAGGEAHESGGASGASSPRGSAVEGTAGDGSPPTPMQGQEEEGANSHDDGNVEDAEGAAGGGATDSDESDDGDSDTSGDDDADHPVGLTFQCARGMVAEVKRAPLPYPKIKSIPTGDTNVKNFPLKPLTDTTQPVAHVFEIIPAATCGLVSAAHRESIEKADYGALPHPMSPPRAVDLPYTMDIITVKDGEGTVTVFKHFEGKNCNMTRDVARSLCHTQPFILNLQGVHAKIAMKAIELMKERVGGAQASHFGLVPNAADKKRPSPPPRKT